MSAPRLTSDTISGTSQDQVRSAISRAAQRTGVDFSYLLNQAKSESGLNPNARAATSSASGLYQFIDQSWLGIVKQHGTEHGFGWAANAIQRTSGGRWTVSDPQMRQAVFALRNQAEPSALMAAEYASDNADGISQALGRSANATDLYFGHFLGLAGATKFLKAHQANPTASAANLFPREASVNRGLFYTRSGQPRSLDDLYNLLGRKISGGRSDAAGTDMTPAGSDPIAAMRMAKAGDLVPIPDGSPDGDLVRVLAAADMPPSAAVTDAGTSGTDTETMMAMMQGRAGMNVLKPNPQTARLAYLLLASDMSDSTVTSV